jgi:hypothetical protein
MSVENHGGMMMSTDGNSCPIHQSSPAVLHAEPSRSKSGGTGEGNDEFCLAKYFFHTLICRQILRHAASGFTSPPKEGVLRIFITLKNLSPFAEFQPANVVSSGNYDNHYTNRTQIVLQFIFAR